MPEPPTDADAPPNPEDIFWTFAKSDPNKGMNYEEFKVAYISNDPNY